MKTFVLLSICSIISYSQAGVVPASTTLIRQSTAIAHPPTIAYSQAVAPVAVSYSAPVAYRSIAPAVYSQSLFAPTHYATSPLFAHGPVLAQQSIFAQYPGLVAQSPVVAQYPFAQAPIGQLPVQGGVVQGPSQIPVQGGSPVIEAADNPQIPPQQQPIPQAPPQQSPILGGGSPGATFDDDTVSVEAA